MANLAEMLIETAAEHGGRTAIKLDALELPYVPYFPVLFFGALRLGAVVVPMNPLLKEREVAFHLQDSGANLLFAWHQFGEAAEAGAAGAGAGGGLVAPGGTEQQIGIAPPLADVAARSESDTALILYTSGTTGTPKGAELTHGNLASAARIAVELVDSGPETVTFGALPLFHVF